MIIELNITSDEYRKLRKESLTGLVYVTVEFNTDSQRYEMHLRHPTVQDI